ncbi:hypothetical protein [Helicobacter sp. 16-1353]|uniref:hypothetical protein n=1 Tax=Helicobacter sp. 16-1353 TaxID=2004996 RepID=UPI001C65F701|nr:hypothetical protein [Helicobacter sp. 16-1353]
MLDGLMAFQNGKFETRDITTLEFDEKYRVSQLGLVAKDDDGNDYSYSITSSNEIIISYPKVGDKPTKVLLNEAFYDKYDIDFTPIIRKYDEIAIKDTDTECLVANMAKNSFMKAIFSAINISIDKISSVYESFKKTRSKGVLKAFEKKINSKLA